MSKLFECENGCVYKCRDDACLVCSHCTDVFWDYTHEPYMTFCELNVDRDHTKECPNYKWDGVSVTV